LKKVKEERDNEALQKALQEIKNAASNGSNLIEPILSAVKTYATVGEICDVLRNVFGEYQESAW